MVPVAGVGPIGLIDPIGLIGLIGLRGGVGITSELREAGEGGNDVKSNILYKLPLSFFKNK
tara:strand:- start:1449 stop:1631 length:183 start_codon:yes stop_codon:yes gene_type:complete